MRRAGNRWGWALALGLCGLGLSGCDDVQATAEAVPADGAVEALDSGAERMDRGVDAAGDPTPDASPEGVDAGLDEGAPADAGMDAAVLDGAVAPAVDGGAGCAPLPCEGECALQCSDVTVCAPEPPRAAATCANGAAPLEGLCPPTPPAAPVFEAVACPPGWVPDGVTPDLPAVACRPDPAAPACDGFAVRAGGACVPLAGCPEGVFPAEVPEIPGFGGRVFFVGADAGPGGEGTRASPIDFDTAVQRAQAGDRLVLGRGTHSGPARGLPGVALLGACAAETVLTTGVRATDVEALWVSGLTLAAAAAGPEVQVSGVARVDLRDVRVVGGVTVSGGVLEAARVVSTGPWSLSDTAARLQTVHLAPTEGQPVDQVAFDLSGPATLTQVSAVDWPGYGLRVAGEAVRSDWVSLDGMRQAIALVEPGAHWTATHTRLGRLRAVGGAGIGLFVGGTLDAQGLSLRGMGGPGERTAVFVYPQAQARLQALQLDGRDGVGELVHSEGSLAITDGWLAGAGSGIDGRMSPALTLSRVWLQAVNGGVRFGGTGTLQDVALRAGEPLLLDADQPQAAAHVTRARLVVAGDQAFAAVDATGLSRLVLADVAAEVEGDTYGVVLTEVAEAWLDRVSVDAPDTEQHGGLDVRDSHLFARDVRLTRGPTLRGQGGVTLFRASCLRACRVAAAGAMTSQLYVQAGSQVRLDDGWLSAGRPSPRGQLGVGVYVEGLLEGRRLRLLDNTDVGLVVTRQGQATLSDLVVQGTRVAPLCLSSDDCGAWPWAQALWVDGEGTRLTLDRFHLADNAGFGVRLTEGARFERSHGLVGPNRAPDGTGRGLLVSAGADLGDDGEAVCIFEPSQVDDGSRLVPWAGLPEDPRPVDQPAFACFAWDLPCDAALPTAD